MPTLSDLRRRYADDISTNQDARTEDETIVVDSRQGMKSRQLLDHKFHAALFREQDVGQSALRSAVPLRAR